MSLLVRSALLLALALPVAAAAPPFFGDPFPLTNTRYDALPGIPKLATNGTTLVAAWTGEQSVRVARVIDGRRTTSQYVLPTYGAQDEVAITWTGTNFLVAASSSIDTLPVIMGRLLDANANPIGEPFTIVLNASTPRLAATGSRILLLNRDEASGDVYSRPLQSNGTVAIGTTPQKVGSRSGNGPLFEVATNGSGFMAILSSPEEVVLARFDANGSLLDRKPLSGTQGTSRPRPATIASNGNAYLVVWIDFSRLGLATLVDANGSALPPTIFDEIFNSPEPTFVSPKAVWSGTDWILSYVHKVQLTQRLQVAHLDPNVRTVTSRETTVGIGTTSVATSSLVRHQGEVRVAWSADRFPTHDSLLVSRLPLTSTSGVPVTYDAADQTLLAAAGKPTLSIFVWNESNDRDTLVHLATTDFGGFYLERELPLSATSAVASAGQGFLLVFRDASSSVALRLDENGTPVGKLEDLDFVATSVAWNGTVWAIAGELDGGVVVAEMTPDGVLSTPKLVRNGASSPRIASDGDGFLMVWLAEAGCAPPCVPPTIVRGARLDGERVRLDGADLDFSPSIHAESPAVAWNPDSEQYVVSWIDAEEILVRQVPPDDVISPANMTIHLGLYTQKDLRALTTEGTVALTWDDHGLTRVAFLNVLGNIARMFTFPHDVAVAGPPQLVNIPGEQTGVAFTDLVTGAPHYGAMRVHLAISSTSATGSPETPAITARLLDLNRIQVAWTTPETAITGFRLEYRVGDGPWLEVEEFFDRTIRTETFTASSRERYSFRVRAYSDDGISRYSNVATVVFPTDAKRRSVRK